MIRTILKMGNSGLMQPAEAVKEDEFGTPELKAIVDELWENRAHYDGAGLAAPQLGIFKQIVVVGFEYNERYKNKGSVPMQCIINPAIQPLTEQQEEGWEGCLSVPGIRGLVPRHTEIQYTYVDVNGVRHEKTASGFHARVIQHEVDHLDGVLFPARVQNFKKFGYENSLPEFKQG
jgi:peptide deformylase